MGTDAVLITIPISHYCEKARWALDRAGIEYRERSHLQVIHWVPVKRAGGKKTAPVLVWGERVFTDSAEIVAEASARSQPDRRLFPDDPAAAAEVRELQSEFDDRLGPEGRRWMYFCLRGRRDIAIAYACTGVPAWQRRGLPLAYPLVSRVIDRYLDITPDSAERSEVEVRAVFDDVAERLSDGRPYLCGESFSAADLTFASLAASVLMPPEYGVPLPQPEELPPAMGAAVRELREHPAGAHALRMFREERR
ncbi:MAG TPA: glutathione S-transferase family protein [Solirubrobacterales bacterium]|nr:glutathione S-transferase family protein [Solirubrobacterales bacterium]